MSEPIRLGRDEIQEIIESIQWRQDHFTNEELATSIGVVVANYGSGYIEVACFNGEWQGTKNTLRELRRRENPIPAGIPACPNGHPLIEISAGKTLALVDANPQEGTP